MPPARLRGRTVDLESTWPACGPLRARLLDTDDPERMLDLVEQHLEVQQTLAGPGVERCARAVDLLEAAPTRPIAAVAAGLGLSHNQLDREIIRVVGLTPRVLARLLRMRRLLATLEVATSPPPCRSLPWTGTVRSLPSWSPSTG